MADERRKVWAVILYPESLPEDWIDRIEKTHVAAAVSPLHENDYWTSEDEEINPEHRAGTRKKEHHHVILYFESLKSANQVLSLLEPFGVTYVEPVESPRAYNRYLCHLDQPEKAQYDPKEVIRLNGAKCDMSKPNPTADEQQEIRDAILRHCQENNVTEYAELTYYALNSGLSDWLWYIEHKTVFLNAIIKSAKFSQMEKQQ